MFREAHDSFWPGYDLSSRPFLVYRPGEWAVLLNPPGAIDGYQPYPASWPRLGVPASLHLGATEGLVGQLEFDHVVGGATTVAIPLADNLPGEPLARARSVFAFIIHEAFHQFQRDAFREPDEPSEERYPILDATNNARVALEMHILGDAVRAVQRADSSEARRLVGMFIGERRLRWARTAPVVRDLERAKELVEGTAKYVETRYLGYLADRCRAGGLADPYLCPSLRSVTEAGYLQEDFDSRLIDGALGPADVPRNRIYPTGAAMGVLLDFFGVDWKETAAGLADSLTLVDLLASSVPVRADRLESLRTLAERRYDLPQLVRRARALVRAYVREADAALAAFEAQPGIRVEVQLPAAGTSRSRSSTGKRWVVGGGRRVFGGFVVYTLRRNERLFLDVERTAVLDDLLPQGDRRVTFFVPGVDSIRVDTAALALTWTGLRRFDRLRIRGPGFSFESGIPGTLRLGNRRATVRLSP